MKEKLLEILSEIRPDVDFTCEIGLISEGILESFDLIAILSAIEDEIGIEVTHKYINADNFDSIDAMIKMLEKVQND